MYVCTCVCLHVHMNVFSNMYIFRLTYLVLRLYVGPPIQEEDDGGMVALGNSHMEGG